MIDRRVAILVEEQLAGFLCRLDVRAECPDPGGDPGKPRESIQGLHDHYRRPGQGPHGWTLVFQYSYSSQPGWRDPRTDRQDLLILGYAHPVGGADRLVHFHVTRL